MSACIDEFKVRCFFDEAESRGRCCGNDSLVMCRLLCEGLQIHHIYYSISIDFRASGETKKQLTSTK